MRKNLPVTDTEYVLEDDCVIVSKTDLKGKISYFNDQFEKASGFTQAELMGQPHNIVRHPDMPPEAFDDLWVTLKAGKPWTGAVKNRRKNGDYYWVLASATPIWENGQVSGYMSIRTKLPADQRDEAERVYALIREKRAHRYKVESGIIRRRAIGDHLSPFNGTLRRRLVTMVATLAAFMLIIGLIGIAGVQRSSTQIQSIYQDRVLPLTYLFDINNRMQENILALYKAATDGRAGRPVGNAGNLVNENIATISKVWGQYMSAAQAPDIATVAQNYVQKRQAFVEQGLRASLAMLAARKFDEQAQHLAGTVGPLFTAAKQEAEKLVTLQAAAAKAEYESAIHAYWINLGIAIASLMVGILLGVLLGILTIRAVGRPLAQLNDLMANIAKGDFNNRVYIDRDDETGIALRNLQAMQAKLGYDRVSQTDIARRAALEKKAAMHEMADAFNAAVGGIIETVSSSSTELEAAANTLTQTAETTQGLSTAVAAASEQASANVQSVASAAEEMASSVGEIGRQVQESARIAGDAVAQAGRTNTRIHELSQAAGRIGDVVKLITSVAEQTNLLALNATIEAARAGDAGRGFAVVASEVKALAAQTANATEEIGTQIAAMQTATQDSVAAIGEIGTTITRISEITSTIAAAVEEQGAATQEIARNVQQAALGTAEVAGKITDVNRGAGETGSASTQVLASAQSLSAESNHLKVEVDKFLATVRAA
jgi:aerotaxis receptor